MPLGSLYLTQKCSTVSPGNPFILGSKGRNLGSRSTGNSVGVSFSTLDESAGFFFYFLSEKKSVELKSPQQQSVLNVHRVKRNPAVDFPSIALRPMFVFKSDPGAR